jgi:hypothetical protein
VYDMYHIMTAWEQHVDIDVGLVTYDPLHIKAFFASGTHLLFRLRVQEKRDMACSQLMS